MTRAAVLGLGKVVHGSLLVARPGGATVWIGEPALPDWLLRALGGRHLLQGLATLLRPDRGVLRAGAGIDLLHAVSMLGLAAADRRYRRVALVSAGVSLTYAVLGARAGSFA